ncbi:MAG: hypothetical protein M3347_17765 [Armatimonadota bacterium]|nr:hypothetical protein [Armatimonadota bacterium]
MMLTSSFIRRRTWHRSNRHSISWSGAFTCTLLQSFLTGLLFCFVLTAGRSARADEFAAIPAGDPLYNHLTIISKAGWANFTSGPSHSLTRYEAALETAKAIFTVTASHRADPNWAATAPREALRALRTLTKSLRPELKKLDIDAGATLTQLERILKSLPDKPEKSTPDKAVPDLPRPATKGAVDSSLARTGKSAGARLIAREFGRQPTSLRAGELLEMLRSGHSALNTQAMQLPLSQRLRVDYAVSALARAENDPLRKAAFGASSSTPTANGSNSMASSMRQSVDTGLALDLTDWLTVSTSYRKDQTPRTQSLPEAMFAGTNEVRSIKGGLAIEVRPGVTLTGSVARLATGGEDPARATRIGGGLSLSAWQNRLSLNANLSRLVPEDSVALSLKAAELNVGLDVTQKLSLSLLYQQLFGAQNQTPVDRRVGGGISIKF